MFRLIVMLSALALIIPGIVKAQNRTKGLEGIDIAVEDFDKVPGLELSEKDVESQTLVAIKRNIPKLPVGKQFAAYIYVRITPVTVDGGVAVFVLVDLKRPSHILRENGTDTNIFALGSTWNKGTILVGPSSTIRSRIFETISEHMTQFAADYYRENP